MKDYLIFLFKIFRNNKPETFVLIALQILITGSELVYPKIISSLIDDGISTTNFEIVLRFGLLGLFLIVVSAIFQLIFKNFSLSMNLKNSYLLKKKIVNNLSKSDESTINYFKSGDLLKTLESDVSSLEKVGLDWVISLLVEVIGAIIAARILFKLNFILIIIILIIEFTIIISQKIFVKYLEKNARELRKLSGESMNRLEEIVSQIITIIFSRAEKYLIKSYLEKEKKFLTKLVKQYNLAEANQLFSNTVDKALVVVIYIVSGSLIINRSMTFGELLATIQYIAVIVSPVLLIVNAFSKFRMALISLEKINELLYLSPIKNVGNYLFPETITSSIQFENVDIKYGNELVLEKLCMNFKSGKVYCIVGENGAGKSTIIKSLYRLIDYSKGDIYYNSISIKDIDLSYLKKSITIIPQAPLVLNDTIKANLLLDRKDEISDLQINEVLKVVGLSEEINSLSKGIDTSFLNDNYSFSGGQKQRLSIARALLTQARTLIFDESTASIDTQSQITIMNNIVKYCPETIIINISHRKEIIEMADHIYYISGKSVQESGEYASLLSKGGMLSKMMN